MSESTERLSLTGDDAGPGPDTASAPASGGSAIAVAIGVMNVATYGFTILAARQLGPESYGAFAAVMNTLLVVSVAQLALQATAARRISAAPNDVMIIEEGVRRLTWQVSIGLGAVLVLAAPLINLALGLGSLGTSLLVGLTAVPLTLMGGLAGILQGERRWRPLALVYLSAGVPRLIVGVALLALRPSETTATLAVLIGTVPPALIGLWALRTRVHVQHDGRFDHSVRALTHETARNAMALLGLFAVSNVDVIVARGVLGHRQAGLYAAGLILTKAVLFLPQFVVVLAFPDMADSNARRRALQYSLGLVGALGAVAVLASWLLKGLAIVFVGGEKYTKVEGDLWLFAVLGTLLAMQQLLVYALLAREGSRAQHLLWVSLIAIIACGQLVNKERELVGVVVLIDLITFLVLLVPALKHSPDRAEPIPSSAPA